MTYRFDDFMLDPAIRELRRSDAVVALPRRAFDCLAYLVEHRERAVGRDELIAAVWGRVEISDALLGHTIVKIRRALGDTGNEQRTIRTVPRFGYRWALPVECGADGAAEADGNAAESSGPAAVDAHAWAPASPRLRRHVPIAAVLALVVLAAVVAGMALRSRDAGIATSARPAATDAATDFPFEQDSAATAAMVLPADVDAPAESHWLRYGVMDLVAGRLRGSALPTMPSESVVSLLRQRNAASSANLLRDPSLVAVAALRVLPRVALANGRWRVHLEAFGSQRALDAEAENADAISAARAAADDLLRKLGRTPAAVAARPRELEELLQRSGAAMLADQLAQARDLIAAAPVTLQQQAPIEHRMAQIELRSGDYDAAEARMHALLDRQGLDDALRARAILTLAAAQVRSGRSALASELYDEAIALGTKRADHEVLGVARLGRGATFAQEARYDEATAVLAHARTDLAAIGDGLGVASVDVNLGEFLLLQHRPADALPLLAGAVRQFERLGAREGRGYALVQQVAAELELLDGDAALATSERFQPVDAQTSNERLRWMLWRARADALAAAGRGADAARVLARIDADADPKRDAVARAQAALASAMLARDRGDPDAASNAIAAARVPALRDADAIGWTHVLALQAAIQRDRGDLAASAATTAVLHDWAAAAHDDWRTMHAGAATAAQAEAEGRREAALEAYEKAMKIAARLNVPADLVAVGAPYLDLLIEASQLDTAQAVAGRIAPWAGRDPRATAAQARIFRALGRDDAARRVEGATIPR